MAAMQRLLGMVLQRAAQEMAADRIAHTDLDLHRARSLDRAAHESRRAGWRGASVYGLGRSARLLNDVHDLHPRAGRRGGSQWAGRARGVPLPALYGLAARR